MSVISGYLGNTTFDVPAAIANGQTASGVIDLKGYTLVGIYLPAAFTGTTLTFTVAPAADGTFQVLKATTSGTSLSYTVAQGTYVAIDPKDFYGVRFLKLVSGSSEAGARSLVLSVKGF